jgi:hypothetical protein
MMMKSDFVWENISTHWSDDRARKATVNVDRARCCYFVDYFLNDVFVRSIPYPGKSVHWAEDVAENYTTGILYPDDNVKAS